jgi:hypothetical protein
MSDGSSSDKIGGYDINKSGDVNDEIRTVELTKKRYDEQIGRIRFLDKNDNCLLKIEVHE